MSIVLKKYYKKNAKQWDDFVKSSSNGTIFHLRQFLTYHINRQFNDNSLLFKKNDSIIAVFPATKIVENGKNILFSHPGASYGGFVYNNITYNDAEKIIVNDAAWLPLWWGVEAKALVKPWIKDYKFYSMTIPTYQYVWIDKDIY